MDVASGNGVGQRANNVLLTYNVGEVARAVTAV